MSVAGAPARVVRVETKREWSLFERVPEALFSEYPQFVPPLPGSEAGLGTGRHPFHRHGTVIPFVALRGSRPVGRIAAIVNRTHNDHHEDRTAFIGFFDSEDDPRTASTLFTAAESELAGRGHLRVRGPFSPTQNDPCGVLVDGHDLRPAFLMPWNPPYYDRLWKASGWTPARDLFAFRIHRDVPIGSRTAPLLERLGLRSNLRVRKVDLTQVERELRVIHRLFNETLADEWNFMPLDERDLAGTARDLRRILDPDLVLIAEKDGVPVGFFLGIPDLNELWIHASRAWRPLRMLALGWSMLRKRPRTFRVAAAGVLRDFPNSGAVTALLLHEIWASGVNNGYGSAEISWVQDVNQRMRRLSERIGAVPEKTYRIYEKVLPAN